MNIKFSNLKWESDYNGYEVGFPDVPVVGMYSTVQELNPGERQELNLYINTENGQILEWWLESIC